MKRIISLIVLLLGMAAAEVSAQSFFIQVEDDKAANDGPKVFMSIGPTAGVTVSNLSASSNQYDNFGVRVGATAGVFFNVRFLNRNVRSTAETGVLAIQPEVRFTMLGGNSDDSNLGMYYITVPVMLKVYPVAKLHLEVGPSIGLNISHTPDNIVASGTEFNLKNLRANDVALAVGIGYSFGKLGIGARYYLGFSELASNMPWKNRWLEAGISYSIPLTKKHSSAFFD